MVLSEEFAPLWSLDPDVTFLNHGSYGACPTRILEAQNRYRQQLESEPVQFFLHQQEAALDRSRRVLGPFVGADPDDLVFVHNATSGVNLVLRSLAFEAGQELLTTSHAYPACRNSLEWNASRWGANVTVADIPFPIAGPEAVVDAILRRVSSRTKLAMLDHVTSPTALVFPIAELVSELDRRGVDTLVDGAHAPGMVPLDLRRIGAAYYTGNCHKWLCAPKGAAFLHVRPDKQGSIVPLTISHGAASLRRDRSRFRLHFDLNATDDPSAYLCVADAISYLAALLPGGWNQVMDHNRRLALAARNLLCRSLGIDLPAPDEMLGSMAAIPLRESSMAVPLYSAEIDPLQRSLFDQFKIEVPVWAWPAPPSRLFRVSSHLYNHASQYEYLANALRDVGKAARE